MTSYLWASVVSAPGLLAGLMVSISWIVWLAVRIDRMGTYIEQLEQRPDPSPTCRELGQCVSLLTGDHCDREVHR